MVDLLLYMTTTTGKDKEQRKYSFCVLSVVVCHYGIFYFTKHVLQLNKLQWAGVLPLFIPDSIRLQVVHHCSWHKG